MVLKISFKVEHYPNPFCIHIQVKANSSFKTSYWTGAVDWTWLKSKAQQEGIFLCHLNMPEQDDLLSVCEKQDILLSYRYAPLNMKQSRSCCNTHNPCLLTLNQTRPVTQSQVLQKSLSQTNIVGTAKVEYWKLTLTYNNCSIAHSEYSFT